MLKIVFWSTRKKQIFYICESIFLSMRTVFFILLVSFFVLCCKQEKRYHDEQAMPTLAPTDALADIQSFHNSLNAEFKDPDTSPLPDRYRKNFEGLEFFNPDTAYRIWGRLIRTPNALPFAMPTTTARTSTEVVYGLAELEIRDTTIQLELYRNVAGEPETAKDDLFLPFLDPTNGEGTYTGGRYLDVPIPTSDSILIDFNKAYNPYCVYNKKYSCLIVPKVNTIPVPIEAGVKDFEPTKKP